MSAPGPVGLPFCYECREVVMRYSRTALGNIRRTETPLMGKPHQHLGCLELKTGPAGPVPVRARPKP